jgi:hypothetical protein
MPRMASTRMILARVRMWQVTQVGMTQSDSQASLAHLLMRLSSGAHPCSMPLVPVYPIIMSMWTAWKTILQQGTSWNVCHSNLAGRNLPT